MSDQTANDTRLKEIWQQTQVPVVYRSEDLNPLLVRRFTAQARG